MSIMTILFVPIMSILCCTSVFGTVTESKNSQCCQKVSTEQKEEFTYDNSKSYVDDLLRKVEDLQENIDNIELDLNRELSMKLDDLLGFRNIVQRKLKNNNSPISWIINKFKLYRISRDINKVESDIRKNNIMVENLNKEIDSIIKEIARISKTNYQVKFLKKYCNCD